RYPYGCAEQTISTSFPLIALRELGPSIAPAGTFDGKRVSDKVQAGITRLLGMQTSDGGIAMWPGERQAWPWASVYAMHFLIEAEAAGHAVPDDLRDRLLGYVRHVIDKSGDDAETIETQAYACYVLALAGKPPLASMNRLGEICKDAAQARLHLALAYVAAGRRDLAGPLVATRVIPRTARESGGSLGSPARDRAIQLEAMLAANADSADLPVLAQR